MTPHDVRKRVLRAHSHLTIGMAFLHEGARKEADEHFAVVRTGLELLAQDVLDEPAPSIRAESVGGFERQEDYANGWRLIVITAGVVLILAGLLYWVWPHL